MSDMLCTFHPSSLSSGGVETYRRSRNRLAATIGDLDARLQIASRVHQPPFVFPLLAGRVVLDLPRLIESLEPAYVLAKSYQ